ncbi:MAG: tRNA-intron lyase [Candidatus Diapherotrites archaeon]|nr:tRNA-intron lyase [Candidatus Diapherotrites archaeon]
MSNDFIYNYGVWMSPMALLAENKVVVFDRPQADRFFSKGFGEKDGFSTVLDLFEAFFLVQEEKLSVEDSRGKKLSVSSFLKKCLARDKKFYSKYAVFRVLRQNGFVVRTGLKFGFDFRVYPKGKRPGEAHTHWVVQVCPEDFRFTFPELSRMVRLSGNIRTSLLLAVVDRENDVNFYSLARFSEARNKEKKKKEDDF